MCPKGFFLVFFSVGKYREEKGACLFVIGKRKERNAEGGKGKESIMKCGLFSGKSQCCSLGTLPFGSLGFKVLSMNIVTTTLVYCINGKFVLVDDHGYFSF